MKTQQAPLFANQARLLEALGQRLREARLRRRFSAQSVAVRAGISRPTLFRIEQGEPAVTLGAYVQVLRVLGLDADLDLVAKDDALGRRLQDEGLTPKRRAPKRKAPGDLRDGENGRSGPGGKGREFEGGEGGKT